MASAVRRAVSSLIMHMTMAGRHHIEANVQGEIRGLALAVFICLEELV